ncbi:MAG: hypothetical protein EOP06_09850, partial [Proteobacteria bacterium]
MLNNRFLSKIFLSFVVSLIFCVSIAQSKGDTFRVFYLGGQSNMEGFGYIKDLPADLSQPMKDVYIFDGNRGGDGENGLGLGKWEQLRPGHGTGFQSDGKNNKLSDRFGPELSFAKRMREMYPNDKIAIVKYARNGSGLDSLAIGVFGCWAPEYKDKTNQYDHFMTTLKGAFDVRDINGDGRPDTLIPTGILWMQGESDASFNEELALRYYGNLKQLVGYMRAAFRDENLPVVVGKISDSGRNDEKRIWKYGELVQYAQEKFVRFDGNAAIVRSTSGYNYSDAF